MARFPRFSPRPVQLGLALTLVALGASSPAVAQHRAARPAAVATARPDNGASVVATVGDRRITLDELRQSFALDPVWTAGMTTEQAYSAQLQHLVDRKLFAVAAYQAQLDAEPSAGRMLGFFRDKAVIKALYHREILDHVTVTDTEMAEAYARSKRKVVFNYVVTPDEATAEGYAERLKTEPFGQIELTDPTVEVKATTGPMGFNDLTAELEPVVLQLDPGQIAGPIAVTHQGQSGFMVVQLVSGEIDRGSSAVDFAAQQSRLRQILTERKAGPLAGAYVQALMADKHVRLVGPAFNQLADQLSRFVGMQPIRAVAQAKTSPFRLTKATAEAIGSSLPLKGDEVVVTFVGGQMTAREVLEGLSQLPTGLRSSPNMAPALKLGVGILVRNRFLAQKGYEAHLDRTPTVVAAAEREQDAYMAERLSAQRGLAVAPASLTTAEIATFTGSPAFAEVDRALGGVLTTDPQRLREVIAEGRSAEQTAAFTATLRGQHPVRLKPSVLRRGIAAPDEVLRYEPVPVVVQELFQ